VGEPQVVIETCHAAKRYRYSGTVTMTGGAGTVTGGAATVTGGAGTVSGRAATLTGSAGRPSRYGLVGFCAFPAAQQPAQ
jgi:hypothetical protein